MEVDSEGRRPSAVETLRRRKTELQHHGVKGMRWGVRKAKSSTQEIIDARARQQSRVNEINRTGDKLNLAKSPKEREALAKKINQLMLEHDTSEDRVTGSRFTTGEKVAQAILLGPLALVTIGANKHSNKKTAKSVDALRAQVKG